MTRSVDTGGILEIFWQDREKAGEDEYTHRDAENRVHEHERPDAAEQPGLTRQVLDVAKTHAKGRLVSCLEGGYNLEALAESVQAHLEQLLA